MLIYKYNKFFITLLVLFLLLGVPIFFLFINESMGYSDSLFRIILPISLGLFCITEYFSKIIYQKSRITRATFYQKVTIEWDQVINIKFRKYPLYVSIIDSNGKRVIVNIGVVKKYHLLKGIIYSINKHCNNDEVLKKVSLIEESLRGKL